MENHQLVHVSHPERNTLFIFAHYFDSFIAFNKVVAQLESMWQVLSLWPFLSMIFLPIHSNDKLKCESCLFDCFQRQICDGMILFVWDFFLSFSSQNDAFGFNQACVNCHWMHCNVHWSTSFPWWRKCRIGQVHHLEIIQNHLLFLHCCCHNLVLPSHQTNTNDFWQINMVAKENHFIVFRLENTRQENIVKNNNTWMEQNRLFIDIMENHNSWHHICS